jgi:hypothetical protein
MLLHSCNQKAIKKTPTNTSSTKENNNYKVQKYVIVKGKDTISLYRKFISLDTKFIDTIILKQGVQETKIMFPSIGYHSVESRSLLPQKKYTVF